MIDDHVFRPDHQLFCVTCGEGELMGNHGIIAVEEGQQVYASAEVAELYKEYEPTSEDDLEEDD